MSILIIDNFDSFTFNLYQMLSELSKEKVTVKRNNELTLAEIKELKPSAIVLSPGPGHPALDRDFGVCKEVVQAAEQLDCAVLGVCLGHQGIAQHRGGNVVRAPQPVHGKMSAIKLLVDSPLFSGITDGAKVMRYHSLIAEKKSLPESLQIVAQLETDPDIIMALQDKKSRLYGLQFHPESVGTALGKKILENFLSLC